MTPYYDKLDLWNSKYPTQQCSKMTYYNNTSATSTTYTTIPWTMANGTTSQQITVADDNWATIYINDNPPSKRVYLKPPLAFNKYVNGSDLLEEFIAFVGSEGVRQGEVLELPVKLFIQWLIVRAFEADDEEPPADIEVTLAALPKLKLVNPRCTACGRYVSPRNGIELCDEACAAKHFSRRRAA